VTELKEKEARLRIIPLVLIVGLGTVTLALFALSRFASEPQGLVVITYMPEGSGLRTGSPVLLAGVQVGKVSDIRLAPQRREAPAEVRMLLDRNLQLPGDAVVRVGSAGVLGETLLDIDMRGTTEGPIRSGAVLKTVERPTLRDVVEAIQKKPCSEAASEPDARTKP
jgi:phospholipid/cholesterol/gamma-HCH transport system substrate-binding protein